MGDLIFGSRGYLGKFLGKGDRNGKSPNLELSLRELKTTFPNVFSAYFFHSDSD